MPHRFECGKPFKRRSGVADRTSASGRWCWLRFESLEDRWLLTSSSMLVGATELVVSAPSSATAGSPFNLTITAEDQNNNVVTSFSDSVTLSDSLGGATFSGLSFANGVATVSATLDMAGSQSITAIDATATIAGTSSPITVAPAAASKLLVSALPLVPSATYAADVPWSLALDHSGNLYVENNGNGTDSSVAEYAPGSTVASVVYSAGVSGPDAMAFDSSGNVYVANYTGNTVEEFAQGKTAVIATYSAGVAGPAALAFDSSGNLYVANYDDGNGTTVEKFAPGSTTASAVYTTGVSGPAALIFDSSGNLYVANFSNNTLEKFAPNNTTPIATYTQGVFATDALAIDSSGNLYAADYTSNAIAKFAPGSTTPSATYTAGVHTPYALAVDSHDNLFVADLHATTVTEYAPGSTTPSATYTTGVNFPVGLAVDSSGNLYVANNGTGNNDSSVQKFSPLTAGGTTSVVITAEDRFNNVVTGFSDSVTLSDSLGGASFSGISFTGGLATVTATLNKAGAQTVTAVDAVATISGVSNPVTVSPAAASKLLVSASPSSLSAGSTTGVTITAEDQFNNVVTGFSDSVTLADSLGGASFSAVSFIAGKATVTATLVAAGVHSITAIDTVATISGTSSQITVSPAAASKLLVSASPSSLSAGGTTGVTITAEDQFSNVVTGFSDSVTLADSLGGATFSAVSFIAGKATVTATLVAAGVQSISATDTAHATVVGTSNAITVTAGAANKLLVSASPSTLSTGQTTSVTITAEDQYNNVVPGFSDSITLSDSLGSASFSAASFSAGKATVTATLDQVGTQSITATDSTATLTAASNSISVTPGAAAHGTATQLVISAQPPSTVTVNPPLGVGSIFGLTVTAEDAEGNVVTDFTGNETVSLADNPGNSTLGGTLVATADHGVAVFSGLSINNVGSGYTLQVSSPGLTPATTSSIDVTPMILTITGAADDLVAITFQDATNFTVTINGTTTAYKTTNVDGVVYNGPASANSQVVFWDPVTTDSYKATQTLASTVVTRTRGVNFEFDANNSVENLYVYVSNSGSVATSNITAGTGSNFFVDAANGGYSYLADPVLGIYSELSGFPNETATGAGGTTYAYVYSTSHASFSGAPGGSSFTVGGVTSKLSNFPQLYVVGASDGTDSITLHSEGGVFAGTPSFSYVSGTLNGGSFLIGALNAANVLAQADTRADSAYFYSETGDTFTGGATSAMMVGGKFQITASNFATVVAVGTQGGEATLNDAPGNNQLLASGSQVSLDDGVSLDEAHGVVLEALGFQHVTANATLGDFDPANIGAIDFALTLNGHWYRP